MAKDIGVEMQRLSRAADRQRDAQRSGPGSEPQGYVRRFTEDEKQNIERGRAEVKARLFAEG